MNKLYSSFLLILLFIISPIVVSAMPPVFILGFSGGPELSAEDQQPLGSDIFAEADASLGWRGALLEKGYISFASLITGKLINLDTFQDREDIWIKTSFPGGPGRITLESGMLSSITGISDSPGFINPKWVWTWVLLSQTAFSIVKVTLERFDKLMKISSIREASRVYGAALTTEIVLILLVLLLIIF